MIPAPARHLDEACPSGRRAGLPGSPLAHVLCFGRRQGRPAKPKPQIEAWMPPRLRTSIRGANRIQPCIVTLDRLRLEVPWSLFGVLGHGHQKSTANGL